LAGMAMSWTNFNINLTYVDSLNYPDTCVIVLQASGANPSVNDYLWVDNLALTGSVPVVTLPDPNPVGLLESAKAMTGLNIYPNPAENLLHVKATFLVNDLLIISLFDVTGKKVFTKTFTVVAGDFSDCIQLGQLPSGLYQVQLIVGTFVSTKTLALR